MTTVKALELDVLNTLDINGTGTSGSYITITTSQTTNRVITIPDATDTLIGKSTTDVLTNKILTDVTNTITSDALKADSGTNNVSHSAAAAPTVGYGLVSISSNVATWQDVETTSDIASFANVNFTAGSAIASIDTDNSLYKKINDNVTIDIDVVLTTDTSGPGSTLTLNLPVVPCAGPSGTKYTAFCIVTTGSTNQIAFSQLDSGVSSGSVVTITSLDQFLNSTQYTIRGQIFYEI